VAVAACVAPPLPLSDRVSTHRRVGASPMAAHNAIRSLGGPAHLLLLSLCHALTP